jgi:hypothetical protein
MRNQKPRGLFPVAFLLCAGHGVVITNRAKHHDYPVHGIESIEWPFLVFQI